MCMLTFDYPQTYAVAGSAEEQVTQLRAYIWRLVEALNQANDGNRQEAVNDGNTCAALKKKLDKKGGTVDGSLDVCGSVLVQGALQSETLLSAPSMTVHNDAEEASATLSCGDVCAARLTCLSQDGAYQNVRLAVGAPVGDDDAATKEYVDGRMTAALLKAYPVGAIYLSTSDTSPETLFGGTWERIEDRFLLAAGTTYEAGATGGEATHTLTATEMPNHQHPIWAPNAGGEQNATIGFPTTGSTNTYYAEASKTAGAGGGGAHNNMPPYIAVYVWKRTA